MDSRVIDPDLGRSLEAADAAIDAIFEAGLDPADEPDAVAVIGEIELLGRRLDAARVELMAAIDRRDLHRADGHATAKTMVAHVAKLSRGEVAARDQSMRMCRDLPRVRAAWQAGEIGTNQVNLLGRIHANRRVRHAMPAREPAFLDEAANLRYQIFMLGARRWERLTDQDGPEPANQRNHEARDARLIQDHFDLSWELAGHFAALQGASMREILDRYIDAEYLTDWEKARAEHGDDACSAHLPRTAAQRRADALWQIFHDAAGSEHGAVAPDFVHNIIWDAATFEEMVARLSGDEPQAFATDTHRCQTLDGAPLEPTEAIVNAAVSAIRRVVVDAAGVVIDQGRARSFTAGARHAVKLAHATCVWPGCPTPSSRCEADHLREHARGGRTNPGNGAPLCGRHNRWKQKGFSVHRDAAGGWHTYRPDGTEVE